LHVIAHDPAPESVRVDRWLWSVRLCKSRAEATNSCRAGHVRINGRAAKPASTVAAGDRVDAHVHGRNRTVDVVRAINMRVGAPIAVECYVDNSPPPPTRDAFGVAERERGAGRPTKRERRKLDRWRGGR
jgi:ribosome-associated heat shock protein Hsp15